MEDSFMSTASFSPGNDIVTHAHKALDFTGSIWKNIEPALPGIVNRIDSFCRDVKRNIQPFAGRITQTANIIHVFGVNGLVKFFDDFFVFRELFLLRVSLNYRGENDQKKKYRHSGEMGIFIHIDIK